jgi:cyclopropane fatty-acyl-phospholipid synthase-like methyltransferase
MTVDHFAHKADTYEQNRKRVENVSNIGDAVLASCALDQTMHLMDFGSGTGLLLEQIAPHVGKITAVDISPAMNQQLREKLDRLGCPVEIIEADLEKNSLALQFDGIISSMTMHHIADIPVMLAKFHEMLKPGGFIALADLDAEDGSFHSEDTGVFHNGFDRADFARQAEAAGFQSVQTCSASVIKKPHWDFGVFLLTALKAGV